MKFIKNNKLLVTLLAIAIIMFSTILIIIFSNLGGSNNEYGNRLDNIEQYPINNELIDGIKSEISALDKVDNINYNLEGRLANFIIYVDDDLNIATAQEYANKIIQHFSDELKTYYDIQILIDSKNEESENYPIIGYKHKTTDMIVWKQ